MPLDTKKYTVVVWQSCDCGKKPNGGLAVRIKENTTITSNSYKYNYLVCPSCNQGRCKVADMWRHRMTGDEEICDLDNVMRLVKDLPDYTHRVCDYNGRLQALEMM